MEKVSDQFLVEREFVDVIPPTPTTSRRLNVCASTEVFHESDAKIFKAQTKAKREVSAASSYKLQMIEEAKTEKANMS